MFDIHVVSREPEPGSHPRVRDEVVPATVFGMLANVLLVLHRHGDEPMPEVCSACGGDIFCNPGCPDSVRNFVIDLRTMMMELRVLMTKLPGELRAELEAMSQSRENKAAGDDERRVRDELPLHLILSIAGAGAELIDLHGHRPFPKVCPACGGDSTCTPGCTDGFRSMLSGMKEHIVQLVNPLMFIGLAESLGGAEHMRRVPSGSRPEGGQ